MSRNRAARRAMQAVTALGIAWMSPGCSCDHGKSPMVQFTRPADEGPDSPDGDMSTDADVVPDMDEMGDMGDLGGDMDPDSTPTCEPDGAVMPCFDDETGNPLEGCAICPVMCTSSGVSGSQPSACRLAEADTDRCTTHPGDPDNPPLDVDLQTPCRQGCSLCGVCEDAQSIPTADETCDGMSQDCDAVDGEDAEGYGAECMEGVGACQRTGRIRCPFPGHADDRPPVCTEIVGGAVVPLEPGTPEVEVCDEVDNDCDESTDEQCTCEPLPYGPDLVLPSLSGLIADDSGPLIDGWDTLNPTRCEAPTRPDVPERVIAWIPEPDAQSRIGPDEARLIRLSAEAHAQLGGIRQPANPLLFLRAPCAGEAAGELACSTDAGWLSDPWAASIVTAVHGMPEGDERAPLRLIVESQLEGQDDITVLVKSTDPTGASDKVLRVPELDGMDELMLVEKRGRDECNLRVASPEAGGPFDYEVLPPLNAEPDAASRLQMGTFCLDNDGWRRSVDVPLTSDGDDWSATFGGHLLPAANGERGDWWSMELAPEDFHAEMGGPGSLTVSSTLVPTTGCIASVKLVTRISCTAEMDGANLRGSCADQAEPSWRLECPSTCQGVDGPEEQVQFYNGLNHNDCFDRDGRLFLHVGVVRQPAGVESCGAAICDDAMDYEIIIDVR